MDVSKYVCMNTYINTISNAYLGMWQKMNMQTDLNSVKTLLLS